MDISIVNKTKLDIDQKKVQMVIELFLNSHDLGEYSVSVVFVGNAKMRSINLEYRGIDRTTDVLSFTENDDFPDLEKDKFLGEIFISYSQVKKQARRLEKSIEDELVFILVHGLLHLLGYDDETEKDRLNMINLGEEFIEKMLK